MDHQRATRPGLAELAVWIASVTFLFGFVGGLVAALGGFFGAVTVSGLWLVSRPPDTRLQAKGRTEQRVGTQS